MTVLHGSCGVTGLHTPMYRSTIEALLVKVDSAAAVYSRLMAPPGENAARESCHLG